MDVDSESHIDDDFNDDTVSITFASGEARHTKATTAYSPTKPKHSARSKNDDFQDDTVSITHTGAAGLEGVEKDGHSLFTGDTMAEAVENVFDAGGNLLSRLSHMWDKTTSENESIGTVAKTSTGRIDLAHPEDDAVSRTKVEKDSHDVAVKITTPDGVVHEGTPPL